MAAFEWGVAAGREWARKTTQRVREWVEENPGQALLVALGAGFIVGQLFFRRRTPLEETEEEAASRVRRIGGRAFRRVRVAF